MAHIRIRFKSLHKPVENIKLDLEKLNDEVIKAQVTELMENEIKKIVITKEAPSEKIEESWVAIKNIVKEVGKSELHRSVNKKKKNWMTEEILGLMDERRQYKNKNHNKYKELNRVIRSKIRIAKSEWFSNECSEIEEYDQKHDSFHLHKKVNEIVGSRKSTTTGGLVDQDGKLILEMEQKLIRWTQYIQQLFADKRNHNHGMENALVGPPITMSELEKAIKGSKNRKAIGPDEIPIELIKLFNDGGRKTLLELFNAIYNTGYIPADWLRSTFVTLPKKPNTKECNEHRTISLMSHVLKIFLKVIHQRIYPKIEETIGETQFGFRKGLGTREALFGIQVLTQRCRDINCNVFLCFIDFEKAFDKIKHDRMIHTLKRTGIDDKDIRIIANLYWNQKVNVKLGANTTEDIEIHRGVRQGCILSPLIFNAYSEMIFKEALDDIDKGVRINGIQCNNIRYADDTVLIADDEEGLQVLVDRVAETSLEYGLKLNTKKTKYMIISKDNVESQGIQVNREQLERVHKIKYLGCTLNDDWNPSIEIKIRIETARAAFAKLRKVICGHDLNLNLRMRMVRCYVFSILLYGVEAWTITEAAMKKLEAFEMWVYRRMLKISWKDFIRNDEVLRRMGKEREISKTIKIRKLSYFGHLMRHPETYNILHLIIQGKIEGKRGPGRRRTSWLKNLRQWFGQTTGGLFRVAVQKVVIANMIANVR